MMTEQGHAHFVDGVCDTGPRLSMLLDPSIQSGYWFPLEATAFVVQTWPVLPDCNRILLYNNVTMHTTN